MILLGAALLGAGSIAMAQSTPYSTPQLSATFNGPVTVEVDRNKEDTSTDTEYSSSHGDIYQMLSVRTVTAKDLDVKQDTLDFYVEQALGDAKSLDRKMGPIKNTSGNTFPSTRAISSGVCGSSS